MSECDSNGNTRMTVASLPWRAKRVRSVTCCHDGVMAIASPARRQGRVMSQHLTDKELQKLPYMERVREVQSRQQEAEEIIRNDLKHQPTRTEHDRWTQDLRQCDFSIGKRHQAPEDLWRPLGGEENAE